MVDVLGMMALFQPTGERAGPFCHLHRDEHVYCCSGGVDKILEYPSLGNRSKWLNCAKFNENLEFRLVKLSWKDSRKHASETPKIFLMPSQSVKLEKNCALSLTFVRDVALLLHENFC